MASEANATLADKLVFIPNIGRALASAIRRLITHPFSSSPKANTLFKDVVFAGLREHLSIISPATEQWITPTTETAYLNFAKKQGFQPETDVLPSGLKVFWYGPKKSEKIILYCHGGGYSLSASPGHLAWLFDLQQYLSKTSDISVVLIGYTLAPRGQYPIQLRQATEALIWLLETQQKKASNVILAGDSAGGNMAMSLISHMLHPHPEISSKVSLSEPLAGLLLISPWVSFDTNDESVKRNATSDYITAQSANRWSSLFLGPSPLDKYNQPVLADADWFKGLDLLVKDILIWGGGGEILLDSIEAFAKTLKEAHTKTEVVIEPVVSHEDFIISRMLRYEKGEGTKVIESWVLDRAYS